MEGKICLITGSTGIAAATAELLSQRGAKVFIASRTEEHGRELVEKLHAAGGTSAFLPVDLTLAESTQRVTEGCLSRFGGIDALFNVAGISGRRLGDGPIHECSEEGWDTTLDTNVRTMFLMCRAVLKQMLTQETGPNGLRGSILNMASVLGFSPSPHYFATHAYAASKGAILGLTKAMAAYYAPLKIRVNAIAPALVETPMSLRAQQNPDVLRFMRTKQPLVERMISAEEVARAAVFLMSDDACAITGDVMTVDSGWSLSDGQF